MNNLNDKFIRTRNDKSSTLFLNVGISFILIGLFITYLLIMPLSNLSFINKIFVFLCIFFFMSLGIIFLYFSISKKIQIKKTKYLIVEDTLKSKDEYNKTNEVSGIKTFYKFRFDELDSYNINVDTDYSTFESSDIGDSFYLVFYQGIESPLAFNKKAYTIGDSVKDKVVSYKDIESFSNISKESII